MGDKVSGQAFQKRAGGGADGVNVVDVRTEVNAATCR